jgi:hypothetical protein
MHHSNRCLSDVTRVFRTPSTRDDKFSGVRQNLHPKIKPRHVLRYSACFLYTYNLPMDSTAARLRWNIFIFRCRNWLSAVARYPVKSTIALSYFTWNLLVSYFLNFVLYMFICLVALQLALYTIIQKISVE